VVRTSARADVYSWLTPAELEAYPWSRPAPRLTWQFDAEGYAEYRRTGAVPEGAKQVGGPGAPRPELNNPWLISPERMDRLIDMAGADLERWATHVEQVYTQADICDAFVHQTLPTLHHHGAPDDVRMVFWLW